MDSDTSITDAMRRLDDRLREARLAEGRCPETAIVNVNAGVAMCHLDAGHEGKCRPHPSFWDAV